MDQSYKCVRPAEADIQLVSETFREVKFAYAECEASY
jgi:hypothetical protein